MSHYNLVHEMNPETISEENHKKIAKHRILLNNKVDWFFEYWQNFSKRRCEFDSADYMIQVHHAKTENERELDEERALNPPMIKKKTPLLKGASSVRVICGDYVDNFC